MVPSDPPAACSPTGMHGQNVASGTGRRKPFAPRRWLWPTTDQCAGARLLSISGRSPFLNAAFRSTAPRTGLTTDPQNRVNVPGLHLRNDPQIRSGPFGPTLPSPLGLFLTSRGAIRMRNPLPDPISGPVIRLRASAPLQDLSIPRDQSLSLTCEPRSLPLQVARSSFAPRSARNKF